MRARRLEDATARTTRAGVRAHSPGASRRRVFVPSCLLLLSLVTAAVAQTTRPVAPTPEAFYSRLDLEPIGRIAVHREGRVKALESFAREMMAYVTGRHAYEDRPALVTYLDLMLRPEAYEDAEIISVKSKLMRAQIAAALRASVGAELESIDKASNAAGAQDRVPEMRRRLEERLARFTDTGMISEPMLFDPRVRALLARLETDLLRTARLVRALDTAVTVKDPDLLADLLRVVPPPGGDFDEPWSTIDEAAAAGGEAATRLEARWDDFQDAWRRGDAAGVNEAGADLAGMLAGVNPELYPSTGRLAWESRYFRMKHMVWVWIVYALALIPLVLHLVFRWRGARWLGMTLFVAAFGLHTFAVLLRWYVADRWPNTNMFEAVTTAAWFGGCFAVVLEVLFRRSPVRGMFAIGSSAASMVALMAAHFMPIQLNPTISNRMPVLHDVWLYIHTNVIIFSYCLIFMASVSALLYLAYRGIRWLRDGGAGGAGGADEYARVGGAGSLIMTTPQGGAYLSRARTTLGQVLDGTTMIVLELSFILLWAGLVMGAIWADHSWGRPWGWDPKEVFALNTFIIFALLIHTRMKVRDKGLWTAVLALIGCAVMLFNWIVINFTISGLHSYA